ncbi:uncharacterized protein EV154DRAFT_421437 [Mucor mucedo]|uniref:uncharacterized protein n=1 Tax=Mucor mucedo TaxID=29922 RepID=UPI00221E54E6|nr:uncharacterized protein EV154DRAFT_421437 [Mucor mucedo]KAI7890814.1 hypothetical protein EV154DRAFT_421437 [Mucor mucedo]
MLPDEDQVSRIFACPQCPKIFATRSNLKRHMENPNIHNIPYVRSRDQKRWKGHSKKVVSKEETTESNNDRMRKWRAENREKNRQNDLRCRVYRLARQKYGENDSSEKQGFVREEIARRLGRRMMMERREANALLSPLSDLVQLPFYSAPQQKIELPSIDSFTRTNSWSSSPPDFSSSSNTSSPILPHLSPTLQRRTSSSSISSVSSITTQQIGKEKRRSSSVTTLSDSPFCVLPSMHAFLSYAPSAGGIKYVDSNKILDEFVGVVLNYVDNATVAQ